MTGKIEETRKLPAPFTEGEYQLIRSSRRTIAVEVTRDARMIVRAPCRATQKAVDYFISEHADWIEAHLAKMRTRQNILAAKSRISSVSRTAASRSAIRPPSGGPALQRAISISTVS